MLSGKRSSRKETIMRTLGIDGVVVVEDHGNLSREIRQLVDEGTKHRLHLRRLGRAKRGKDALAETLLTCPPERGDQVREEADRVVVSFVKRHPGG